MHDLAGDRSKHQGGHTAPSPGSDHHHVGAKRSRLVHDCARGSATEDGALDVAPRITEALDGRSQLLRVVLGDLLVGLGQGGRCEPGPGLTANTGGSMTLMTRTIESAGNERVPTSSAARPASVDPSWASRMRMRSCLDATFPDPTTVTRA